MLHFCNAIPATARSPAAPLHTALKPNLLVQHAGKPSHSLLHSLIHPGIRAEMFSPPAHQLTCFTSSMHLSPPSLTNMGTCPQFLATSSAPAWLTAGLFTPPPTRGLIYRLNFSLPCISEEPVSIHTRPGTHHLSPTRASSSSVQTTGCTKPA